jgi:O-antigen/teichoic acid export membrane protein
MRCNKLKNRLIVGPGRASHESPLPCKRSLPSPARRARPEISRGEVRLNARFYVVLTVLTRVGGAGIAACSAVVLAHVVGKEGIGLFALLRALPAVLVMLTELGIASAAPYLINRRKFDPGDVLGNAVVAGTVIGLFQIVLWIACHQLIGSYVLKGLPIEWVLAAALLAPIEVQMVEMQGIFRSLQRFWTANLLRLGIETSLLVSLGIAAAFDALSVATLVPCLLLPSLFMLTVSAVRLVTLRLAPVWRMNFGLLRESIRFGIRAQASSALQYLNFRLDHLILGILTGPEVVGLYFVATRAAELFRFLPSAVGFVITPRLAGRSFESAVRTVRRHALPIFLINLAAMVVGAVVGPYLFPILFDDWSLEAIVPFWILLVGLTFMGANGAFSGFNDAQGIPELNAYSTLIGLVITIALDIALIPLYGQIGAAIASSVSYAAIGGTLAFLFWRTARSGPKASASQYT